MEEIEATILAKGAPNLTSDGRKVICSIAVSETHGLVRFYPLHVTEHKSIKIWTKAVFRCSRGKKDTRRESWRVDDYEITGAVESPQDKRDVLESCILHSGTVEPVAYQNEQRASIAIVKPHGLIGAELQPRHELKQFNESEDEDGFAMVQANFPYKPYVTWYPVQRDPQTKDPLRMQLVGQEVYEGMRKFSSTPFRVFENLRIGDVDYEHWMILGNINNRRNTWVVAHLHRQKKVQQADMLSSLWTTDGRREGWPYLMQEEGNARDAGPQMQFSFITDGTK